MRVGAKQAATLSDYVGKKVSVICEGCEVLRHLDGGDLLAEHGDASMPSLLANLAIAVGCERSTSGFYDRCKVTYYFSHKDWCERAG